MMPLVFDGADSAAGQGRVKAARSAPVGPGLYHGAAQARVHQSKTRESTWPPIKIALTMLPLQNHGTGTTMTTISPWR